MWRVSTVAIIATIGYLLLAGCIPSEMSRVSIQNQKAIPTLLTRMHPKEVVSVMKGDPFKTEHLIGRNGKEILVFYYLTSPPDNRSLEITDSNLTPLIFVDYELLGWGWVYLDTVLKKYEPVEKSRDR